MAQEESSPENLFSEFDNMDLSQIRKTLEKRGVPQEKINAHLRAIDTHRMNLDLQKINDKRSAEYFYAGIATMLAAVVLFLMARPGEKGMQLISLGILAIGFFLYRKSKSVKNIKSNINDHVGSHFGQFRKHKIR
jgi:hypothetical protein